MERAARATLTHEVQRALIRWAGRGGARLLGRPLRDGELAAAGGDIDAATLAHGAPDFELRRKDVLKHPRGLRGRGRARVSISRIERDQIHLRGQIAEEFADGPGVGRRVVFPLDERPLVEDAATRGFAVSAARGHEFVERPFFRGGDERGAFGLIGGVEGNGEMDRTVFSGEAEDAWHDAHGAEGDALGPEREAVGIAENIDRVHDRIVVMERLAHAHEDEVAETLGYGFVTYYVTSFRRSFRAIVT